MNGEKEKFDILFTNDTRLADTPYVVRRVIVTVKHVDVAHFATLDDANDYVKIKEERE